LEVRCFFFIACSPDGNDSDPVAPDGHECRPHHLADAPDYLTPRLIERTGLDFQAVGVVPQSLRADEVDAVLLQVGCRLRTVELEVIRYRNYTKIGSSDLV
jgi:hypothetical protein